MNFFLLCVFIEFLIYLDDKVLSNFKEYVSIYDWDIFYYNMDTSSFGKSIIEIETNIKILNDSKKISYLNIKKNIVHYLQKLYYIEL